LQHCHNATNATLPLGCGHQKRN